MPDKNKPHHLWEISPFHIDARQARPQDTFTTWAEHQAEIDEKLRSAEAYRNEALAQDALWAATSARLDPLNIEMNLIVQWAWIEDEDADVTGLGLLTLVIYHPRKSTLDERHVRVHRDDEPAVIGYLRRNLDFAIQSY